MKDKPSGELIELKVLTKNAGKRSIQCWRFSRDADGLLEAIKIFGAVRLIGFINNAIRQGAINNAQREEDKNGV